MAKKKTTKKASKKTTKATPKKVAKKTKKNMCLCRALLAALAIVFTWWTPLPNYWNMIIVTVALALIFLGIIFRNNKCLF